ncbi:hypothetical protein CPB84DRAFT_647864 [Gymnopilus junonius]|uniref:Ubiquitin-like domain-containing protein n=1 Tax=Gymnopilus junonius TaxID=109634 RepID=A0A9P5N7X2_GYMJU|nr:hypothetical protein CPB84DRAFT_647864 [Gymnopilus junonius]
MMLPIKTLAKVTKIRRRGVESRQIVNQESSGPSNIVGPSSADESQSAITIYNSQSQTTNSDTTVSTQIRECATFGLSLLQPVVGGVPLAGPALNAVVCSLLGVLNTLNQRDRNKRAVQNLTTKLTVLEYHLNTTTINLVSIENLRTRLTKRLGDILDILKKMRPFKISKNAQVMQDLIQCSVDIEYYLQEFSVLGVVCVENEVSDFKVQLQKFMDSSTQLNPALSGVVKVIDPTGKEYSIPLDFCYSYEQFDKALLALFEGGTKRMKLMQSYVECGMIDFHFKKGNQGRRGERKKNSWDYMEAGMTIQMGLILQGCLGPSRRFKCPKCRLCVIDTGEDLSADCRYCEVRFQISMADEFYPYTWEWNAGARNSIYKRIDNNFTSEPFVEDSDLETIRHFRLVMVTKEIIIKSSGEDLDDPLAFYNRYDDLDYSLRQCFKAMSILRMGMTMQYFI